MEFIFEINGHSESILLCLNFHFIKLLLHNFSLKVRSSKFEMYVFFISCVSFISCVLYFVCLLYFMLDLYFVSSLFHMSPLFLFRWFMRPQHVEPEESVQIHLDVRSEKSIGIHWGTFKLTHEVYLINFDIFSNCKILTENQKSPPIVWPCLIVEVFCNPSKISWIIWYCEELYLHLLYHKCFWLLLGFHSLVWTHKE